MNNKASIAIGVVLLLAVGLAGYWFWVPDVGALRSWEEFKDLPTMQCTIGDASVEGLSGTMYIMGGRLRADYKVEGNGVESTFRTIVFEDGTSYTWADNIAFAERSTLKLGEGSTEENLFGISRCKRVWNMNPDLFVLPIGMEFHEKGTPLPTEYDAQGNLLPEEVAPTQ